MVYVYGAAVLIIVFFVLSKKKYKRGLFENLPKKEHPLREFYGCGLWLHEKLHRNSSALKNGKAERMIRSLYVKENVSREISIYHAKKTALCITVLFAAMALGLISALASAGEKNIAELERNEYGEGNTSYELGIEYRGSEETVTINVEERKYTEDEIYGLFESAYEEIKKEALLENESWEKITGPIDLMSSYGDIDIYWEIDDPEAINYRGEIETEMAEGEKTTVNLFAEFSLEDVTVVYPFYATLVYDTPTEAEALTESIMEAIEKNNDIHEGQVKLPETIDGEAISFRETSEDEGTLYLILGLMAAIAIVVAYERKLEEKLKKRQDQMLTDFTEIVSKLGLLYEAGLSIHKALERIVSDFEKRNAGEEHFAYLEIKLALEKIRNGMSEGEAYEQFGKRCGLHSYIKLGSLLSQNISKGSKGMKLLLSQEVEEAFEERKRSARKKGEEAGTKMLLPMMLLLGIVLVIAGVPALMSINF